MNKKMKQSPYTFLTELLNKITEIFGDVKTEIAVSKYTEEINIIIFFTCSIEEACDLLDKFDEEYWLNKEAENFNVLIQKEALLPIFRLVIKQVIGIK